MKEITINSYEVKLTPKSRKLKVKIVFEVDLKDLGKVPINLFPTTTQEGKWTSVSCEEYREILEAIKQADENEPQAAIGGVSTGECALNPS